MKPLHFVMIFLATISFSAFGQATDSFFVGTWKVSWERNWKNQMLPQEATLVIDQAGRGSWNAFSKSRKFDNCYGHDVAAAVVSSSENAITIQLKQTEAMLGCAGQMVELRRGDNNTVFGTLDSSTKLALTKK